MKGLYSSLLEIGYEEGELLKKGILLVSSIATGVLVTFLSVNLYTHTLLNKVKEKVIETNTEIEHIVKINSIGKWGEWFSEYVLEVEMNGENYRIWTNKEGEILEKEDL